MAIETLDDVRHDCLQCGGSCHGHHVHLLPGEDARIRHVATLLGVADPVVDGRLRHHEGHCVFQRPDGLCGIHAEFGLQAKPAVCSQYPVIAIRVGDDLRVGVDPGCFTAIQTWRTGPEIGDGSLLATRVPLGPGQDAIEERLVDLLADGTVADALAAVCGVAPSGSLPPGFAGRLVARLQGAGLDRLVDHPDTAPMIRTSLTPLVAAVRGWDPANPPPWPALSPAADAFAVDAVRRQLWLRLLHGIPVVHGAALLALSGAVACGWASTDDASFGRAFAAWCRALRVEAFWRTLTPDQATMAALAAG